MDTKCSQIINVMKGLCAIWVIMLHAIPSGGGIYKLLGMPFFAQMAVPVFMIITGFTYTVSYEKHRNYWSIENLVRKIRRIILPIIPVFIFEILIYGIPDNSMKWLLSGGYQMPGSYYFSLLLQLMFLFPIIKLLSEKINVYAGFIIVFVFQCTYEIFTYVIGLDAEIYRVLVFRYIIFIYGGIAIYKLKGFGIDKRLFWITLFGFGYIVAIGYLGYRPSIIFRYQGWSESAAPVAFFIVPIIDYVVLHADSIGKKCISKGLTNCIFVLLQSLGKASYHIYLIQMLWFGLVAWRFDRTSWRGIVVFIISVIIAGILGTVWYYIEKRQLSN